jgi:Ig-like domain-containing protein
MRSLFLRLQETPSPSARHGAASRALRLAARLALTTLGLSLLPMAGSAQDLILVKGDKTLTRITGAGVVTETAIAGLPAADFIVGAKQNYSVQFPSGNSVLVTSIVTEEEDTYTTSRYTLDLSGSTPTATNGCVVDGGNWMPNAWPLVGYGSNLNDFFPPNPYTALIDTAGYVYGGPSCGGSPGSGTQMNLTPAAGVIWATMAMGDLYVLKRSASEIVLSRIHWPNQVPFPGTTGPPTVTQTWNVTDMVGASQVMGMTLDCTGRLWAYVNRPGSCFGHGWGDLILAHTDETLASGSTLTLKTYLDIGDWFNGGVGCLTFPKVSMFFEKEPPSNLEITGSTSVIGCASALLTATWDGGQESGVLNPGAIQVQKGEPFTVTPGVGQVQTYTLTVAGLSCESGSTTHTVTSYAISIDAPPTVTDPTPCASSAVTFSAPVSNLGSHPVFTWRRWNGSSAGSTVATGNPSTSFVPVATDDGEYVLVVSDDCGFSYTSDPVSLDVQVPALVGTASGGGPICAGSDAQLSFPVSGQPLPNWKLWSGGSVVASGVATGTTVQPPPQAVTGSAIYVLEVWNECNGTEHELSPEVVVTRAVPPELVVSPPASRVGCAGQSITLSASATGDAPIVYQWFKDGGAQPIHTGSTLTLTSPGVSDSGSYRVVATNPASTQCGADEATCVVTVVGTPLLTQVGAGTNTSGVALQWTPVAGAAAYRVYRADNAAGIGKQALTSWSASSSHFDAGAIPGHSYFYSVGAATDGAGSDACQESASSEGWRALMPPFLSATHTNPQPFVLLTWTASSGAGHYRVYRRASGEPDFSPLHDWTTATSLQVSGNAFESYEYVVRAAIDAAGAHASADSNLVVQSMPCGQPGQECGTPDGPGLIVLIDRSYHMLEPSTLGTRWNDAVDAAQQGITAFFSQCPAGSVAIWTFAGNCLEDLTVGFLGQAEANAVLASLPPLPSAVLGAPLAAALCEGISTMCTCFGSGGTCTIPTASGPKDKLMLVLSSGINDPDLPGLHTCDGPNATSGTNCTTDPFLPSNSWPRKLCNRLTGTCPTLYVVEWSDPFQPRGSGPSVLASLAARSGGLAQTVVDGDPLPESFFGDCNGNAISDALDIQSGTSQDCNQDDIPDECQGHLDCNANGIPDSCDLAQGTSTDENDNDRPDECEGFVLSAPVLPLAGVHNEFHVIGGTPFAWIQISAVLGSGPGWLGTPAGGGGWRPDLTGRRAQVLSLQQLDASGHAAFWLDVPPLLAGTTAEFWGREVGPSHTATPPIAVTFR